MISTSRRAIAAFAFSVSLMTAVSAAPAPLPYKDPSLPVEDRVADLLARMTVDEKIGQTLQPSRDYIRSTSDITTYGFGSILSGGGSAPSQNSPVAWADMIDRYQKAALESRLGIPMIYGVDAVHGHNNVKGAVIFPHNIGMGAANDPELMVEEGRVTAEEMLATGARWDFGPCIAVALDERWGRSYESFGTDPTLVGALGAAEIRGLQDGGLGSGRAVLANPKHFAGDGGTDGGRNEGDATMDEETFLASQVAPYAEAIAAGAECVMVSFSSWNGLKDHANRHLLTDILRGRLGFKGFVVSDWGGAEQIPGGPEERVATAFNAGIDMFMLPDAYDRYRYVMRSLIASGRIDKARLDQAVSNILRVKFELGLFERPFADRSLLPGVGSAEHRAVARKAVAESLVVLKNEGSVLPIGPEAKRILVVGQRANDIGAQCGGWTITWQGSRGAITAGTTIYKAIAQAAGPGVRVELSPSGRPPEGFSPDLAVVVVGEDPYAEGRGNSADLSPTVGRDQGLLSIVAELKVPIVTVLLSGRPLILGDILEKSSALVAAWLPGTEGGGVADVLFGLAKASGRLPRAWPASVDQLPIAEGKAPLFPRGFGLNP